MSRCDFISTILRRGRMHFYRVRAGDGEDVGGDGATLLINLSRDVEQKESE